MIYDPLFSDAPTVFLSSRAFTVHGRSSLLAAGGNEERNIARMMRYLLTPEGDEFRSPAGGRGDNSSTGSEARIPSFYSENYLLEEDATYQEGVGFSAVRDPSNAFYEEERGKFSSSEAEQWDPDRRGENEESSALPDDRWTPENPGLNEWTKRDLSALYTVAETWKRSYEEDNSTAHDIIRR